MTKPAFVMTIIAVAMATLIPATTFAAGNPEPCEKMLGELKTAIKGSTLTDAEKAKVADLQGKGLERCKADDDAGADAFFAEALKLLHK